VRAQQLARPIQTAGVAGWLPLAVLSLGALSLYNSLNPWAFMWGLAVSIYAGLKWLSWWKARFRIPHTAWRSIAYLLAWPGMDAESFLDANKRVSPPRWRDWFWAGLETSFGAVLLWVVARALPPEQPLLRGWTGMVGLVLLLHFGTFQLVALVWQSLGIDAMPIMSAPLLSQSLSEFWGKRWNLGFRQLSHDLIFGPLHRDIGVGLASFLVFAASGLIHDLVISVPARGGYGLPTIYFVLQGLGVTIERSSFGKVAGLRRGLRGWFFMAAFTLGPVGLLFHPPFVLRVIIPFMRAIHCL
jgi:Membrane bound O-acyl transferase family